MVGNAAWSSSLSASTYIAQGQLSTFPPVPAAGDAGDPLEREAHNPTASAHKRVVGGESHQICS